MNKIKLTSLAVVFATTGILCSCTAKDYSEAQSDSATTVTSGQIPQTQTASETTSPPQDSSPQASQTTEASQNVSFSQVGDFRKINIPEYIDYLGNLTSVSDNVICGVTGISDNDGKCSYDQLGFIDISSGEFFLVPVSEEVDSQKIRKGSGDVLCVLEWDESDHADDDNNTVTGVHKCIANIKKDYSIQTNTVCSMSDVAFDLNGHKICEWKNSIYDVSSGTENKIVEGVIPESANSKQGTRCSFLFGIDDNRFAYSVIGYESKLGFGVYDFSSGISTILPDTEDKNPLGIYNGKIFSVSSPYNTGCSSKIYVTDPDTMTTSLLTDVCESDGQGDVRMSMSEDGRRIAAVINRYNADDNTYMSELCILDSSDGHIIKSYDISNLGDKGFYVNFIDNNTIIINDSNHYIMDIE